MFIDLPLEELHSYRPEREEPPDFDTFWAETLAASEAWPLNASFDPAESPLRSVDVFDVTFNGYRGQAIKGWLLLPKDSSTPLPCVVEYIGYGGGRGFPHDWLFWSAAGYAHLVMDTRGQGSAWRQGDTPDRDGEGVDPQYPGFVTRGILDPHAYYYRRVFVDAVRAVAAARSHPAIDPYLIAVSGGSQGGGITLAVAGLAPDLVAVMPDVPFLCNMRDATRITDTLPYGEIAHYCKIHRHQTQHVFETLAYFDGMQFATRATAPALFSAALMDDICPPRTVFAAYNYYQGPKDIRVWPFNGHEGGESYQTLERVAFLARIVSEHQENARG